MRPEDLEQFRDLGLLDAFAAICEDQGRDPEKTSLVDLLDSAYNAGRSDTVSIVFAPKKWWKSA